MWSSKKNIWILISFLFVFFFIPIGIAFIYWACFANSYPNMYRLVYKIFRFCILTLAFWVYVMLMMRQTRSNVYYIISAVFSFSFGSLSLSVLFVLRLVFYWTKQRPAHLQTNIAAVSSITRIKVDRERIKEKNITLKTEVDLTKRISIKIIFLCMRDDEKRKKKLQKEKFPNPNYMNSMSNKKTNGEKKKQRKKNRWIEWKNRKKCFSAHMMLFNTHAHPKAHTEWNEKAIDWFVFE